MTKVIIRIHHQKRNTMAFHVTPKGAVVLIPRHIDPDGDEVQQFIEDSLAKLPEIELSVESLTPQQIHGLVDQWSQKIGVDVQRTQIRSMKNKWGSISTAGVLTLADDILRLQVDLAEYVVVHELLHLKIPDHGAGWQVSMGMYVPDWRQRERRLVGNIDSVITE